MADEIRLKVREIVMRHGWNAACYQIVNPIFEYAFYDDLDSVIAFVRAKGRRVAAGGPVCPEEHISESLARFEAAENSPVLFFGSADRMLTALGADSQRVFLGAQPIWNPACWEEHVMNHSSLRYQFRRAEHKGVAVREWPTVEAENSSALRAILDDWLKHRGMPPLHFMVEPETLDFLMDRRTFVAEQHGEPVAFLNLCPVPLRNGWLTEQFPRLARAPNGTVELLMHEAAKTISREGAEYLTMGLVPLSEHAQENPNPPWLQWTMEAAKNFGSGLYSFRGLDSFKSKFEPESWEPIYAISYKRAFNLRDLLAIGEAFAGRSMTRQFFRVIQHSLQKHHFRRN